MQKTVILGFYVDSYDREELDNATGQELYEAAKKGVDKGIADIYTLDDFLRSINDGDDCLSNWWVYYYTVDEDEADKWLK